jgi:hypothetical protein
MKSLQSLAASLLLAGACAAGAAPAATAASALSTLTVTGEVLEAQTADVYTYVRLKTSEGEVWAAVAKGSFAKGSKLTIGNAMVMDNFESKTLKRKFDQIVFGEVVDPNAAPVARVPDSQLVPHGQPAAPTAPVRAVPRAAGANAKTVAEVVTGKKSLNNQPVVVRAQVVKVSVGIMGKNWLHLQDGSGSGADGSNDLIVTTKDVAKVGDIVVASGKVKTDVDFGSGYQYAVLIDDASVKK